MSSACRIGSSEFHRQMLVNLLFLFSLIFFEMETIAKWVSICKMSSPIFITFLPLCLKKKLFLIKTTSVREIVDRLNWLELG